MSDIEELKQLKHLAIAFIKHADDVRKLQMEAYASDVDEVKEFAMRIPTFQTSRLQMKIRKVADMDHCDNEAGKGMNIVLMMGDL